LVPVPPSNTPLAPIVNAQSSVLPLPIETVPAFVDNVPVNAQVPLTVRLALVVPSQVVKLPAVTVRLLATVRAKEAPEKYESAQDALLTVRLYNILAVFPSE
jgi:hypothetical protein